MATGGARPEEEFLAKAKQVANLQILYEERPEQKFIGCANKKVQGLKFRNSVALYKTENPQYYERNYVEDHFCNRKNLKLGQTYKADEVKKNVAFPN